MCQLLMTAGDVGIRLQEAWSELDIQRAFLGTSSTSEVTAHATKRTEAFLSTHEGFLSRQSIHSCPAERRSTAKEDGSRAPHFKPR